MKTHLTALALGLAISTGALAKQDQERTTGAQGIGFLSGALVGAAAGGPPGAMVGSLLGFFISNEAHNDKRQKLANQKLAQQHDALMAMQERLVIAEQQATMQMVSLEQLVGTVADIETSIQFRTGSDTLEDHYRPQLSLLSDHLRSDEQLQVQLSGYADHRGDDTYNQTLSEQRVDHVRQYLLSLGVAEQQILSQAYGETNLISAGETSEDHFFDRRVLIKMAPASSVNTAAN